MRFFMKHNLAPILGAQFFSSLADNALLIAAIALLTSLQAPDWMTPLLRLFFTFSYIALAAWVGILADMWPKGHVMFFSNALKIAGCLMLLLGCHPLLSYAVVGAGAAAYSPAKYGILAEILPPEKLVVANGWMEGLTVVSIILGVVFGGLLVDPSVGALIQAFFSGSLFGDLTIAEAAIIVVTLVYVLAALFNLTIADTGARYPNARFSPIQNVLTFARTCKVIFQDPIAITSLSVTTLFWGTGAVLQFLVLRWAEEKLHMPLSQGAMLQAIVSVGIAFGAVLAARYVPMKKAFHVLWTGIAMGLMVAALCAFRQEFFPGSLSIFGLDLQNSVIFSCLIMIAIGTLAGLFLVPMNAVFQNRGHTLLSSGQAVAVQNLAENTVILSMLGVYSLLVRFHLSVNGSMLLFGLFFAFGIWLIIRHHARHQRKELSTLN